MADEKKRALILTPQRIQHAEFVRNTWVATAEEGTVVEDVLDPGYWSHKAAEMRAYDRVEVRVDTGEWLLELLVLDVGRNWAKVSLLQKFDLQPMADGIPVESKYSVKWGGPVNKWRVIRNSDSEVLSSKHDDRIKAEEWLRQYEVTVGTT